MMSKISRSRRKFLKTTSAFASAPLVLPNLISSASPNGKLNHAVIGSDGQGWSDLNNISSHPNVHITAICDVDTSRMAKAAAKFPDARKYQDWRELLDAEGDKIDSVQVAIPDHMHASVSIAAMKKNKHVYCEKPLTRDVFEARVLTNAAKAAGVDTQMGTQIHAGNNYRRVVEKIQAGAIGPVREVHIWVSRAWGWQSQEAAQRNRDIVWSFETPTEMQNPPAHLDWDLWIGPAPFRPFHSTYFPGPKWYRWWDFGNGTMSDLGSHWNDLPFWALKLDAPKTVEAWGPPPHHDIAPASICLLYTSPSPRDQRG